MYIVVIFMVLGLLLGYFTDLKKYLKLIDKAYVFTVILLLFLMGVSIGNNKDLFSQFNVIGVEAILIAIFSIIGSVVFAYVINKKVLKIQ